MTRRNSGLARAASLTPERRREIAQQGAAARWGNGGGLRHLYVVSGYDNCVKLGNSADPKGRMELLQTACPRALTLEAQFEVAASEAKHREMHAHALLSHVRRQGEWFEIDAQQAVAAARLAASLPFGEIVEAKPKQASERSGVGPIRSIRIDEELWRRLGRFADRSHVTMSEALRQLVIRGLDEDEAPII